MRWIRVLSEDGAFLWYESLTRDTFYPSTPGAHGQALENGLAPTAHMLLTAAFRVTAVFLRIRTCREKKSTECLQEKREQLTGVGASGTE